MARRRERRKKTAGQKYGRITEFYTIGKCLGEGTFGKVRKGVHLLSGVKVAIKILMKKRIVDVADVERVAREITILKKVKHINIIRLFEVVDTPKYIFLIMEFAEGGELFDYIVKCHRVPEAESCRVMHMIINAVDHCHKNNIIHRDLKPENLLLDRRNVIKLVDFGLGNIVEPGQLLKTACGSPCYAAPEMIAGMKYEGTMVDIWSMGVILYALVCGYLPFEHSNTNMLYRKIINGDFSCPKWMSQGVQNLVRRMLCTDPKKRFSIEKIRHHPWYKRVSVLTDPFPNDLPCKTEPKEPKELNAEILNDMEIIGYNRQQVISSVKEEKHDHHFATYYLLEIQKSMNISGGTFDAMVEAKRKQMAYEIKSYGLTLDRSPLKPDLPTKAWSASPNAPRRTPTKPTNPQDRSKNTLILAGNQALHIGTGTYRISPEWQMGAGFKKKKMTPPKRKTDGSKGSSSSNSRLEKKPMNSPSNTSSTANKYSRLVYSAPVDKPSKRKKQMTQVPRLPVQIIKQDRQRRWPEQPRSFKPSSARKPQRPPRPRSSRTARAKFSGAKITGYIDSKESRVSKIQPDYSRRTSSRLYQSGGPPTVYSQKKPVSARGPVSNAVRNAVKNYPLTARSSRRTSNSTACGRIAKFKVGRQSTGMKNPVKPKPPSKPKGTSYRRRTASRTSTRRK